MKEIKTSRINGYLDLDNYFIKKLGREFIDLEDLYINDLISYETVGISEKFWILSCDQTRVALYKEEFPNSYESYVELLVEEIAKVMDIPVAHYDLATFSGNKGVISYNFLKQGNVACSGFDVIADFYESKLEDDEDLCELYNIDLVNDSIDNVCDNLNNLQDIWSILEDRFKNSPMKIKIIKSIMDGLINKLILDIVVVAIDSHSDNWQIIDDEYLSVAFDNSRALGIHNMFKKQNNTKLQDNKLLLTVDNENINKPLEVLNYFLKISSSEYRELIINKVNKLQENFNSIPDRIEKRTHSQMPEGLKNYFIDNMSYHLSLIDEIIYDNKVTKKKTLHILQ